MCFVVLLGTKTSSGQITAPLALLLVSLILPLQVVPATVFPIECNLNNGLQKEVYPLQYLFQDPLHQAIGFNIPINSSPVFCLVSSKRFLLK